MTLADIISSTYAATTVAVLLLSIIYYLMKNRNIVPGPRGLPYFGLFPFLKDDTCHLQLEEIGRKYGDLYSFTFLGNLIINLGSAKAIRECHMNKSDCFAGRFTEFNLLTYILEDGVAMVNGDAWKSLRKYFVQAFRQYGLTVMKDSTATPSYKAVEEILEELNKRKGVPFNVIELLTEKCTGTMQKVLYGEEGVSSEALREMNVAYGIATEAMGGVNLLLIGPIGKLMFHTLPTLRRALVYHKKMRQLLVKIVDNIKSKMDESHPTCIIEDFYKERNDRRHKNDPTWKYFTDKALINSLSQFTGDGILGVAYFIGCFLHALVEHPEEQEKIYKELLDVVGPTRSPTSEDRGRLSYTNAFLNEVVRTSNFFSLFPSLQCTKETTVRGYRIPKGAITMLNMWQAHHDPVTYENPEKFNPSRFLPTDGKQRPELPVLFGMGKRACTGESFVMLQAFLFVTNIVKNFHISEPKNLAVKSGLFLISGYMELIFTPRTENS